MRRDVVMVEHHRSGPGDRRATWRGGRRAGDHRQRPIVLVVDNHADSRELIAVVLGGAQIGTAEASSGVNARQRLLEAPRPCAVIMDLRLPDCHGTDLIRAMRLAPETVDLPILVLSASVTEADRRGATAAGATAFLSKPTLPDDLLIAVRAVLERRP